VSSTAPVRDDLPKLEKYELIEEIGHGGMATVYRATDLRLGREVAVKIIHRHLRENKEVATRFIAEARAAAKLKHKNIVEVYDVSSEEDRERFLVVELVSGPTLRQVLVDHRDMPAEIGACIGLELCDALDHAHAHGIIHRDIKPENVLVSLPDRGDIGCAAPSGSTSDPPAPPAAELDEDDNPKASGTVRSSGPPVSGSKAPRSGPRKDEVVIKITDFGIAKILDAHGVTSTGQVLGSPAHMAPEQIEGGEVDPRTDVFAIGVILYECFVGHLPFDGKNPAQVLRKVIEGKYECAETERASVGRRFSQIIDRALALDPKDRPDTPTALAALLREELEALGIGNPAKEIAAYFRDPPVYTAALHARLVPTLVARGEAARKAKKSAHAAGDFNRANALAPDDIMILKRLAQLGRASDGPRLRWKIGLIAAVSLGLGTAAYAGVSLWKARSTELAPTPSSTIAASGETPVKLVAKADVDPPPRIAIPPLSSSALASKTADLVPRHTGSGGSSTAPPGGERLVMLSVKPRAASIQVDGTAVRSGQALLLAVGPHTVMVTTAADEKCCEPWTGARPFTVPARKDGDHEVFAAPFALKFRPAKVTLKGPAGGQAACGGGISLSVGETKEIPMNDTVHTTSCKFLRDGVETPGSITFHAGESLMAPWPTT